MRRIHIVLGCLGLVTGGAIGVVAGCGSDDAVPIAAPDGAASSSSSTSSSGTSGSSTSSSSSSSGDPVDGSGSTTSSSGSPSNALKISCGTIECDAGNGGGGGGGGGSGLCCVRDGGTNPVCLTATQSGQCDNSPNQNTIQLNCDEGADCPPLGGGTLQRKCCLTRNGDVGTSCGATCGGGGGNPAGAQLCKTDAECSDGGAGQPTCAEKTCRGFKLRVCGTPESCK